MARKAGIGYLCFGAALDFLSGQQTRAPEMFQKTGTEWVWRLSTNPRRLTGRYAQCALRLTEIAVVNPVRDKLFGKMSDSR